MTLFCISLSVSLPIRICHRGNVTSSSINWWQQNCDLDIYLCACKKPWSKKGEKLMENTHSRTNNCLFPFFPLAFSLAATTWKERQPKQFSAQCLQPPQWAHRFPSAQHAGAAGLHCCRGAGCGSTRRCWAEKARSIQNLGPVQEHVWKPTWVWSKCGC